MRKPWNRRMGRPGTWRKRRPGFWWAPAAEGGSSTTTTAVDSCFTPFVSAIPGPTGGVLIIPIIWNVSQNLTDAMVDKLDVAFSDPGLEAVGGNFGAMRHRPMAESWRVERISGHITLEMNDTDQNNRTVTLVHAGILATETLEDGLLLVNPQENADALRPWIWKDQVPITSATPLEATANEIYGVSSVVHRSINVKTRRRIRPETVMNLYLQTDTDLPNTASVLVSPMLRAYCTRTR